MIGATLKTITIPLSASVPAGGTITANYPSGESRKSYMSAGAVLVIGENNVYTSGFSLTLGASSFTVTNPGAAILSGTTVRLALKTPAENAGTSLAALAATVGYVEYAGSPIGNLTPDFIGQRCQDTSTGLFYVAQTATSAGWRMSVVDGAIDIRSYGAKCDGQAVYDAVVTGASAGSMTLTSATANFTAADVGKLCAHKPRTASGNYTRFGTITAVNSSTSITISVSGVTATTGQLFVWGTNDQTAITNALAAGLSSKRPVYFPNGITCASAQIVVPTGVTICGSGNTTTVGYARNFEYRNSSLVLLAYDATSGGFIKLGSGVAAERGSNIYDMNIDCLDLQSQCVNTDGTTRGNHVRGVTLVRGTDTTYQSSASSVTESCTIIQNQLGTCAKIAGDSRFINNYVFGAGNGFHGVHINSSDVYCGQNHIWKDSDTASALGSAVYINVFGGVTSSPSKGSITIEGNQFDTSFGPHILIDVAASTYGRAVAIVGNHGFQNDSVPNATYPCIKINVGASGSLRALSIVGNVFQGSWNDNTKGQYTYLIDGSGITGTVIATTCYGNMADNCAALYNSFAPTTTAGNSVIPGAVATAVTTG